MLCWSLLLVAHTLPQVFCLQESVHASKWVEQGYSLEMMATSIQKLMELWEKVDRRLDEQEKAIHELKMSLGVREEAESSEAETPSFRLHKKSDDPSWEPVVDQIAQKLDLAIGDIRALKNSATAEEGTIVKSGSVYVHWGEDSCSGSAETVYSGFIGGPWHADTGSGSNYLCLPWNPKFDYHTIPRYGHGELFGAEYETCYEPECDLTPTCAVCRISRGSSLMIPANNTCEVGWTLEYSGYLMTDSPHHGANMDYICVDSSLGHVPASTAGSAGNQDGALLYYTSYVCGSLPCPPYKTGAIVLCAVCSK